MTTSGPNAPAGSTSLRVLLVDDSALFRGGLAALLRAAGIAVVGELSDARTIVADVQRSRPDVVVLDARMPPTNTDEGISAARQVRRAFPEIGALVLSTYAEGRWASSLLSEGSARLGYLLKDRVDDTAALIEAIHRIAHGGSVIDPEVIDRLFETTRHRSAFDRLSRREVDVLSLMAQGKSNAGIGRTLHVSARTVEAYVASVFVKLGLETQDAAANRRVLAVLEFLQAR